MGTEAAGQTAAHARRAHLLGMVERQGYCTISELSAALDVSEMTIRRDVQRLADEGTLRSVHGGVTVPASQSVGGPDLRARSARMPAAKRAIARAAMSLLPSHGAVALDAGTTTLEFVKALPPDIALHVVTASLLAINALLGRPNVEVTSLGGTLRHRSQSFAGPATLAALSELRVRTLFLAATAVSADAVYCGNHFDALTKRHLVEAADEVVLLADSSKFAASAMVRACSLDQVDTIVTDDGLSESARDALVAHHVNVVMVDPSGADTQS
ncbi:DeoR/GlpR family DNA-binding transcription regulator [Rugosimonospora acidiphila]|uniref:Lactose phosphotransferase system repressor n=1 Tax=Rugosimonospora acidiphila TaxID=556531 RepID=A0ABP9SSH0_9ACTN